MEAVFKQAVQLRWADMDANSHMRHSVYYDLGASVRIAFLAAHGITFEEMKVQHFGPVLFREEAIFRKEIRYGHSYTISLELSKARRDGSRFSFRHEISREDGVCCAIINVDGAWIDTNSRKLAAPPAIVQEMYAVAPKSADFEWLG